MPGPVQFRWNQQTGEMGISPTDGQGSTAGSLPEEDDEAEPSSVATKPRRIVPQAKSPAPKPKNIVSLAKARLRDVKKELRRMKALEKERGELERLIAAAEKPVAPVAPIKDTKRTA